MPPYPSTAQSGERENHDRVSFFNRLFGFNRSGKGGSRVRRAIRDALDGLPLEKFRRVCGLFDAVVPASAKQKNAAGEYVDSVVHDFQALRAKIEHKLVQKDRVYQADDLGHDAHNLQLLLGELLPASILENALPSLRDDYRNRVSAEVYAAYLDSAVFKALDGRDRRLSDDERLPLLRADYVFLINEVRRLTLLEYHIEEARGFLIHKLRGTLFKLLTVPLLIGLAFLASRALIEFNPPLATAILGAKDLHTTLYYALLMATLLSLAAMLGATGSFVSALLRIEAVPENTEVGRSVVALRSSESIRLAPVTGFVFAILLSFIFGGRLVAGSGGALISGTIFPEVPESGWPLLLFIPAQLAKWLTWSFIVGFSERLMPDMIDRLVARADKSFKEAPPSVTRGGGGVPGSNGAAGNGTHRGRLSGKPRKARRTKPAPTAG